MDEKQQFKAAFISACIEQGHTTPSEVLARVRKEKRAAAGFPGERLLGTGFDWTGKFLGNVALPVAFAAPPILGASAGYGLAKLTDADDTDVKETKEREIIEELRAQASLLRDKARRRKSKEQDLLEGRRRRPAVGRI